MSAEAHNRLATQLLQQLVEGCGTESEAMVLLESVILGVMLYYRPRHSHAAEFLDSITARVIERMPS